MDKANMLCVACGNEYAGHLRVCPDDQTVLMAIKADNRVGSILAERYEIIDVIKSGGMGTVYKARQLLINRIVAIKMLQQNMLTNIDALKRFRLEAQAASRLATPNILTIYDFGLTPEGQPYMVMPYLDGVSLDEVLAKEKRINVLRVLDISIQISAAMAHAHSHGVLHRDIKPSNIMLVDNDDQVDFVQIVDFGIAKIMNAIDNPSGNITKTGELYGSPSYMSPEQCRGAELDARSDMYSLGCVMYASLTGHNFFDSNGMLQTMQKHINDLPPSFSDSCPGVELPRDLECAVLKALAKNPDDRFSTMDEFKEQLQKIRRRMLAGETITDEDDGSYYEQSEARRSSFVDDSLAQPAWDETLAVNKAVLNNLAANKAAVNEVAVSKAAVSKPAVNKAGVNNVNDPFPNSCPSNLVRLSLHASKMTVVSLALSGAAMLSMLAFSQAVNLHKSVKEIVESRQHEHILPAANAETEAHSETNTANLSDDVAKPPYAAKTSHKIRAARKHSVNAPTALILHAESSHGDKSGEVHRHAYSTYWEGE
jgi:serine/threonine protein kinase